MDAIADLILWLVVLGGWLTAILLLIKWFNARDEVKEWRRKVKLLHDRMAVNMGKDRRMWVHLEGESGKDRYRSAHSFETTQEAIEDFNLFFGEEPE